MAGEKEDDTTFRALSRMEGRFYEEEFPQVDDIVVVYVKRIVDEPPVQGAYVELLEYNGREGMMLLSELSKRRIRSVAKLLKVGRTEICMVLRADRGKSYIDLSKRRVEPEDAKEKEDQFAKAKAVHGIMRHVADKHGIEIEDFCSKFSWPLYKNPKFDNAYNAYKAHINGELSIWDELSFDKPGTDVSDKAAEIKADIEEDLKRKLLTQMLRGRAKIEVACTEYRGIESIKEALLKGYEASTSECELKIRLVAHPTFILTCICRERVKILEVLKDSMAKIQEAIVSRGGTYKVVQDAEIVNSEKDDPEDLEEPKNPEGDGDDKSDSGSSTPPASDDQEGQQVDFDEADLLKRKVDED